MFFKKLRIRRFVCRFCPFVCLVFLSLFLVSSSPEFNLKKILGYLFLLVIETINWIYIFEIVLLFHAIAILGLGEKPPHFLRPGGTRGLGGL